jgi:hypothetical protein
MIIGDLYVVCVLAAPAEANPVPVVDSDAVLSGTVATKGFELVAWRYAKFM